METVEEIAAISDFRNTYKKQSSTSQGRVSLLTPMFKELKESREPKPIPDEPVAARELFRFGSDGRSTW